MHRHERFDVFFFFNDTATTEIYTLSLHDALPISSGCSRAPRRARATRVRRLSTRPIRPPATDRKSTRLNSSHLVISYAVFCLKKKKNHLRACTLYLAAALDTSTDIVLALREHRST